MLNVVRVEFSKLRRWKLLRVLPLLSLVLPAITFSYFATHPDYLTDMGLYKQALFSFNIFLILPAILGVLASLLVYNEQRCDVLKQLWIIPMSKGSYLFAKWGGRSDGFPCFYDAGGGLYLCVRAGFRVPFLERRNDGIHSV